jgi:hypothetical protein
MKKQLTFTNLIAIFITIIYYTPCIITINSTMPDIIQYYGSLMAVDDFMEELEFKYPEYHWKKNKGYPTNDHRKAIEIYGSTPFHRKTFNVKASLQTKLDL